MIRLFLLYTFLLYTILIFSTNYYVDAVKGSDDNSGMKPDLAWKSFFNVNTTCFEPGDTIYLARGSMWHEYLQPGGSGSTDAPIVITAYGRGNNPLPLLLGTGDSGKGVVSLYNQSYWEISSLEIIHNAKEHGDRRGVEILAENAGIIRHIYLTDLHIHHVMGLPGNSLSAKKTAGIFFGATDNDSTFTRFDNVLIERCTIHDIINQGIAFIHDKFQGKMYPGEGTWNQRKFTRFVIRDNVIYNISKNAMIVRMTENGLVERNLCFNTAIGGTGNTIFSRNVLRTLFQYNEGMLNRSHDHDGSFYDPDLNSPQTTWRNSYSHRNAHGLLWLCTTEKDGEILVYNNISEHDKGILNYFNYAYDHVDVYNNIYISKKGTKPYLIRENPSNYHRVTHFRDNIIINQSEEMEFEYNPELIPKDAKERRIIHGNQFIGIPLQGEYHNAEDNISITKYIHRGLHHTPDVFDSLYRHRTPNIFIEKSLNDEIEVLKINGIPLYREELNQKLKEFETVYSSLYKSQSDNDSLRSIAFDELLLEKLAIYWMKQKGLKAAEALLYIDSYLSAENKFRDENSKKRGSLFFGPITFTKQSYKAYILAYATEELKEAMWGQELQATDEELNAFYFVGDHDKFDPKWASRGYEYSFSAVERLIRDKKYCEFMKQELNNAVINIKEDDSCISLLLLRYCYSKRNN